MAKFVLDNNQQVAHYFANEVQAAGKGSNLFFEDNRLYSYGKHFCIARRLPSGVIVFTQDKRGNSTAKHLAYARQALRGKTLVYCADPAASVFINRTAAETDIMQKLDEAGTQRRILQRTRDALRAAALNVAETFNEYLAALPDDERGNFAPFDVTGEAMQALRDAREATKAAAEEAAKQGKLAAALRQRETLAAWLAGGPNNGGMHALPVALRLHTYTPSAARNLQGVAIDPQASDKDVIQTSHGAEIPVAHGVALWPIVQSVVRGERTPEEAQRLVQRLGVYTLNTIRANGDIRVGCHEIAYSELARMAVLLKLEEVAA